VLYVPQRPSLLPGTPSDFVNTVAGFTARSSKSSAGVDKQRPVEVAKKWGIEDEIWHRSWANLSGGEAQRVSLAIAVGLGAAEMLLLDG
jgi:ABC-type Mn2+/Zn2+ transport system ATPase subunit